VVLKKTSMVGGVRVGLELGVGLAVVEVVWPVLEVGAMTLTVEIVSCLVTAVEVGDGVEVARPVLLARMPLVVPGEFVQAAHRNSRAKTVIAVCFI